MSKHIKKILIVGGGSSGWMTAAALIKQVPDIEVSLIESPSTPTIGVGESTIGQINTFFTYLGLKDEDWMSYCNATYKTSIKFINFRENPTDTPHVFHYPFGRYNTANKPRMIMEWFIAKARDPSLDPYTFAEFYHDSIAMIDSNKLTKNEDDSVKGFDFSNDTAYHMDATLFGQYLRDRICKPNGLTHILDDVVDIRKNDMGEIDHLTTKNGDTLTADLFIDCTGFKSLLLEETMQVPFVSFSDTLLNDRAIATVIPYADKEHEMESVTSCTAIESGWVWNIPLWNRIGTGYVYSSQFATEEEAEEQFRNHLKSANMRLPHQIKRAEEAEVRHIKIKHGVHKRSWEKNVVGIGLSMGFIEPLESTGLMLTHEGIIKLIHTLGARNGTVTQFDIDCYNFAFYEQIVNFKDFISLHYALSMRDDTPYWKKVTSMTYSVGMNERIANAVGNMYASVASNIHREKSFASEGGGILYITAGMGHNCINQPHEEYLRLLYQEPEELTSKVFKEWQEHRKVLKKHVDTLPSHYEFLRDTIYNK